VGAGRSADRAQKILPWLFLFRGLHCPICSKYICSKYIGELNKMVSDFAEIGVSIQVLSGDTKERAEQTATDWQLSNLDVGYGVTTEQARDWGLHRSARRRLTSIGIEEPAEFSEPGLFIIRTDGTLYWAQISTMPFACPHFREILGGLKFALEKDYPARGELS
jgi:hypothetical protein